HARRGLQRLAGFGRRCVGIFENRFGVHCFWKRRGFGVKSVDPRLEIIDFRRLSPLPPRAVMPESETTYSIGDLAREFDVTPRAIRFYEDEGLLAPQRVGS